MFLRGLARRHRFVRIFVNQLIEREIAGTGNLARSRDRRLIPGKKPRHLDTALEMPFRIGFKPQPRFMDRALLAYAGEYILKRPPVSLVIEHIIGGNQGHAGASTKSRET